jgi:hypothetical protein
VRDAQKRETARDKDPEIHERFVTPSYTLNFLHHPVTDLSVPDANTLKPVVDDLIARVDKGGCRLLRLCQGLLPDASCC